MSTKTNTAVGGGPVTGGTTPSNNTMNNTTSNNTPLQPSPSGRTGRTPNKTPRGPALSEKTAEDLTNLAIITAVLFLFGMCGFFFGEDGVGVGHIQGGFHSFFRFVDAEAHAPSLHAWWPQNMLVTLAILNGCQGRNSGGYWVSQIIGCIFGTFGGLIVNDLLNATPVATYAFWNFLPVTIFCWYLVNHNVPMTDFNLWENLTDNNIARRLPVQRVLNLCTLAFNCSLLFAVAAQHEADSFWGFPQLAKGCFFCVAVHCAGDFFGPSGLSITFNSCSDSANRAVVVYFWIATNGMSTLFSEFLGGTNGIEILTVDGFGKIFGEPKKFLWAIIVLNELLGDLIPENVRRYLPHTLAQEGLNKVFFSSSEDEEWNVEDDADDTNAGAAAGGGESKSSSSPVVAALEARIAQLEAGGASSGINFWNDSVWQTVFSLIALGAVGHFFNDSVAFGFNHMADLPNMFHGAFRFVSSEANQKILHSEHWPHNILVSLAIINGVKGKNTEYWVQNIIDSCLNIFGGLMVNDILNARAVTDFAFWSYLPVTIVCWYLVNHNIPLTHFNVYRSIEEKVNQLIPLSNIMNLCSLAFNCSLLFTVAAQHEAENFWYFPQVAKGLFFCVAVHCAGDFFGKDGIRISFESCSPAANRAILVYFWTATKGLSTLGVSSGQNGIQGLTAGVPFSYFGQGASFLWAMILIGELFGHLIPWKPHEVVQAKLLEFFKP